MAKPRPDSRPPLLRISDREICPKTTATIAAGGNRPMKPQTLLKIALPLVSGNRTKSAAGLTGGAAADALLPQDAQKVSSSAKVLPQPGQNELIQIPFPRGRQGRSMAH